MALFGWFMMVLVGALELWAEALDLGGARQRPDGLFVGALDKSEESYVEPLLRALRRLSQLWANWPLSHTTQFLE